MPVFSKRQRITLRLLYAMSRPSVCLSVCRLSVTLVHPTQAVELFGNFPTPVLRDFTFAKKNRPACSCFVIVLSFLSCS